MQRISAHCAARTAPVAAVVVVAVAVVVVEMVVVELVEALMLAHTSEPERQLKLSSPERQNPVPL
jgi:hypothetical protein